MSECTCLYPDEVCEVCREKEQRLSDTSAKMIEAMKLIPTESGQIMRDLWDQAWAANIRSWVVRGKDGICPESVAYEFYDGTKITWTRPSS